MISNKVKRFAAALFKELNSEAWGDIDPYLFKYIADLDFEGEQGEWAKNLAECIEVAFKSIGVE